MLNKETYNYLLKLIESKQIIPGKIIDQDGFKLFERISVEKIYDVGIEDIAFATRSMGRAIFTLGKDGKIVNYKGVDSHLENNELLMNSNVGAEEIEVPRKGKNYIESNYPINLIMYGKDDPKIEKIKLEIRLRGLSPLEDLIIEAFVNNKMKETKTEVKTPEIIEIKEFTLDFLKQEELPTLITRRKSRSRL